MLGLGLIDYTNEEGSGMIGLLIIMIIIPFAILAAAAMIAGVDSRQLDVNSRLS